ncbi:hypothetical protein ATK30_5402 [Amycolatopsis echigonensis]|uniref:Uncharacterized protein n=1 Tax=Amycolatopsis echigonensis TaxID=2576905 RepID=A0A2N3WKX1_9PSEU|nr:hypothetical protein [Amycolatopsis niigatensis]PKV94523.1 hypothetical protein ATK30_5402 [Amycolatopsis niigatensis]
MTSVPGDSAENSGRNDDRCLAGAESADRSGGDTGTGPSTERVLDGRGIAPDAAVPGAVGDESAASVNRAAGDESAASFLRSATAEPATNVNSAVADVGPAGGSRAAEPPANADWAASAGLVASIESVANASPAAEVESVDGETRDVVRLLRRFGGRAFALAFVAGITGLTTVALVLGLIGFALVLAPVRGIRRGDGPAARVPPGW